MSRWVILRNRTRTQSFVVRARWCSSFACKLRGLSLQRPIPSGTGLILVERGESRWGTAIHMVGMLFALGVVWLDGDGRVVDVCRADPWRIYVPQAPARFTLEGLPEILDRVAVDDVLDVSDADS